jgi:Plavaka transposase
MRFPDGDEGRKKIRKRTQKVRRASKQRLLHKSIELAPKPLLERAAAGINVADASGTSRTCHPAFFSYVADIPEASDIGCTVHTRCVRGFTSRAELASTQKCRPRDVNDTIPRLRELGAAEGTAEAKETEESMSAIGVSTIRSALFNWPFINLHRWLSLPSTFRFEKLHNFFLGLSRMLSICASDRLKGGNLETGEYVDAKGRPNKLKSARFAILEKCNNFLKRVEIDSPCVGLKFDFTRQDTNEPLSGFFTATGVTSMLEGRDYAGLDQVMPFVCTLIHRLCGDVSGAPCAKVFVLYQDMVGTATSRFNDPVISSEDLDALSVLVQEFKKKAIEVYAEHQASGMGVPKFHVLGHLVDDIRQFGSLPNYSADFYEASHKLFKHAFNQTSRRSISGQVEALARLASKQGENDAAAIRMGNTEIPMRSHVVDQPMGERKKKSQRLTRSKGDSIRVDTANLCGGGNKMEWYKICSHAATCRGSSDHVQITAAHETSLPLAEYRGNQELCDDVGGPGRLNWHVARIQELFDPPSSAVLRRPVSANAAGIPFPTLLGGQPQSEPRQGTVDGVMSSFVRTVSVNCRESFLGTRTTSLRIHGRITS